MATLECSAAMWHLMLIVFSSVLGSLNQDKQTNNSKRCYSVLFANLTYLKNFCKFEKDSERSLTFLAPIFISVQFPVGKWESLLATFNCLLFFYSWQIFLANIIYPKAPMALFLPVGSLWKDWLQLKPACGRRSNFAHAQRVDAVGWQRKDWVQKRCPLTHCQDLALGDLSRSAYIHVYLWCCNENKTKRR